MPMRSIAWESVMQAAKASKKIKPNPLNGSAKPLNKGMKKPKLSLKN